MLRVTTLIIQLCNGLRDDPGTGFTFQGGQNVLGIRDQGFFATFIHIFQDSLDLGQHAAFGKMTFFDILPGLGNIHLIQPFLIGFIEVDGNFFYCCADEEQVCIDHTGQNG